MATVLFPVIVFVFGFLPSTLAGNLCNTRFPGKGYCAANSFACPSNSPEYASLSNMLGCPSNNQRCCVIGGYKGYKAPNQERATCGIGSFNGSQLSSRILNGVTAGPCDWPFVVSIRATLRNSNSLDYQSTAHQCAGALFDKQWVITSASCVLNAGKTAADAPNQFLVVAGEYNISGIDIDPATGKGQEELMRVEKVIINPNYAYQSRDQIDLNNMLAINGNGVALIKLTQPVSGSCAGIICLPTPDEAKDQCASYDDCVITGWGFTSSSFNPPKGALDKLKQGRTKLTSKIGCDLVTKRLNRVNSRFQGSICQTPGDVLQTGCLGDEGGAVMCSNGKNWVIRGILPSSVCINNNQFDLYVTDVSDYVQWISDTVRQN